MHTTDFDALIASVMPRQETQFFINDESMEAAWYSILRCSNQSNDYCVKVMDAYDNAVTFGYIRGECGLEVYLAGG